MDSSHLEFIGLNRIKIQCASLRFGASPPPSANQKPAPAPKAVAKAESAPKPAAASKAKPAPTPAEKPAVASKLPQQAVASKPPQQSSGGMPKGKTEQAFLNDTFLFEVSGCSLLEVECAAEPPKGAAEGQVKVSIVLSRTVFHPQGGGQPADVGTLSAEGLPELSVAFVSLRKEDGAVIHDCAAEQAQADAWIKAIGKAQVICKVDGDKRVLNARVHSAGHLLDAAVKAVGLKWVPGKGYHFADGPYVEYVLNDDSRKIDPKKAGDKEDIIRQIQENIDRLVSAGGPVTVTYRDGVRHVEMAGEECPCGGTHVPELGLLVKVDVKKLQNKQGNVRLSYTLPAAA